MPRDNSEAPPVRGKQVTMVASESELEAVGYAISHDLGAPARAVVGFLDLASKKVPPDHQAHEFLSIARSQGRRLQEMLLAMASYTRALGAPKPAVERCGLSEVAQQAATMLQARLAATGAVVTIGELPYVMGNAEELTMLFSEVLDNALLYVREGEVPKVVIDSHALEPGFVVTIRDYGIGVSQGQEDRALRPMTRLCDQERYPGIGMGLASAALTARRHGMVLEVSAPAEGNGLVVELTCPATAS